jgi:hypothetical protein
MTPKIFFIIILGLFLTFGAVASVNAACNCVCKRVSTGVSFSSGDPQTSDATCKTYCESQSPEATFVICAPINNIDNSSSSGQTQTEPGSLENPLGPNVTSVSQIAGKIIQVIISLLGIISLCMFIYAGFTWLTAGGKPDAIKKGKETMIWAVAGLAVVFSSYIVLRFVFGILSGF